MTEFQIKKFQDCAKIINKIEDGKLSLLATRIAQHIVVSGTHNPFTNEEIAKLENSFEMSQKDILHIVAGLDELLFEAAYHKLSASNFRSQLANTEIEESKLSVLVSVWNKVMNAICESLLKKSILPQVSHVSYNLSTESCSDAATYEKNLRARLQLGLNKGDSSDVLDIEFDHEGLFAFHSQLVRIQSQLDAIADK